MHALVDTLRRPLHICLTPGQQHEATVAEELLRHARGKAFLGDTGYDSARIRDAVRRRRMRAVICAHPTRKKKRRLNRELYGLRYLVEVFFHDLKAFRAIATRFEKTARNFLALIHLACATMWLA